MKTLVKTLTIFGLLAIFGFGTVSAQNFYAQLQKDDQLGNQHKIEIKSVSVVKLEQGNTFSITITNAPQPASQQALASLLAEETEEALAIEPWMSDENYWANESLNQILSAEEEEDLEIEAWMSDENYWETQSLNQILSTEKEEDLEIEAWMSDENYWTTK